MFNRKLIFLFAFIIFSFNINAQNCELTIKGSVFDKAPNTPLSYVNILIQELAQGTTTDDNGNFYFDGICPGHYHLIFSHIGCEGEKIHLDLSSDTTINILLSHSPISLSTAVIEGKRDELINQPNISLNRQSIEDNANQNLSGLLENEAGVHLLKNGSGISKPVVHGLYGNRIAVLNNGILQSGQQWGNDHSPEIDPFAADKIIVIKGASAIEYGASNLGSVILVEPNRIEREPHLHGQTNYIFETNGRGHTLNTRLGKYSPVVAWRINGSLKKYGDKKTSNYFLNNTGIEETSLAIQLEKSLNDKLFLDFYLSTFNTKLGILRGSHIGNLSDLEQALINEVPFYTEPNFSYSIEAPKQNVCHHLAKAKAKYYLKSNQIVELVIAGQLNNRKEFDIRRNGRSEIPALSLKQYTLNTDLQYSHVFAEKWKLKIGNQNVATDNTNNPETGVLPLIPDYFSWTSGLFTTLSKKVNQADLKIGMRYDYLFQNVPTISNSIPREIVTFENQYHNFSALLTSNFKVSSTQNITLTTGCATRNPAINELYSNGLHQGVSGIEEGDSDLNIEKAVKTTLEYKFSSNANFSFNALLYHQYFKEYIYLNPQDEFRLTIRGSFPVFRYEQTDAQIFGLDISTQFTISNSLFGLIKYSYLKGDDIKNNLPLIFMPPNSFFGSLLYRLNKSKRISKKVRIEDTEIELNNRFVFKQNNIQPQQDFVLPPSSYNLVGLKFSTNVVSSKYRIRCFIKADNLFNVSYRDYLNRQRYFSDDLGISLTFGINYKF